MTDTTHAAPNFAKWRAGILAATLIAGGGGYYLGQRGDAPAAPAKSADGCEALYYYDPMFPQQKFDKPGKSPFMDMELEPKCAVAARRLLGGAGR